MDQEQNPRKDAYLELFHDAHDSLASLQQHLSGGHLLHHRHLLVHDPEEVHRARCPQLAIICLFWLPAQITLSGQGKSQPHHSSMTARMIH